MACRRGRHRPRRVEALTPRTRKIAAPARFRGGLAESTLRRVKAHIEAHLDEKLMLSDLAAAAGLSVYHFAKAFKAAVGIPPYRYILQRRIEKASEMLTSTNLPITHIALAVGFSDHSQFARQFRRLVGATPSAIRYERH
jgi:AraC-like DNA-binding protein